MERIAASLRDKIKSVEEAAALIQSGSVIGCSGFTLVGEPKAVPHELARQKKADHLTILTGASVGDALDGELTRAGLLSMRYPYQSNKSMRNAINAGEVGYSDMHLSHMPEFINRGGLHIDFALVECAAVTEDGVIRLRQWALPTASCTRQIRLFWRSMRLFPWSCTACMTSTE